MSAVLEDRAERLLATWGLGGLANDQLTSHADNVLHYKGQPIEKTIVDLGIIEQETLDKLLAKRPRAAGGVLQYLHNIREPAVSARTEELHCVESGLPYIANKMPSMQLHEVVKEKTKLQRIQDELTLREVLPMSIGGTLILAFRNYEQLVRFSMMGKADKHASELIKALAGASNLRVEQADFFTAVMSEALYMSYMQQLTDIFQGAEVSDDAIQTIQYAEGDRDATMKKLVNIFEMALRDDVNDVAIMPNRNNGRARVFFRKYQQLSNSNIELSSADREAVTRMLLARSKANPSGSRLRHPADGNLNYVGRTGQAFMRLSFLPLEESSLPSTSVSIRLFPKSEKKIQLQDLRIVPEIIDELNYLSERSFGLFVVCGPTGSGKSTTIAGMLGHHYDAFGDAKKRISVEQPCERILPGVQHIDVSQHNYQNTQAGGNGENIDKFAMALRAILRHDPDLIFVGEVRDKESCMVSIDSANTGHLVFTTTHANDPVLGYRRLASFLDAERRFDLVNVLEGILAQRLLPLLCQHCSTQVEFTEHDHHQLERYARANGVNLGSLQMPTTHGVINSRGCSHCINGLATMVPVHGLLTMNPDVRHLLLSPNSADYMRAQEASDSQVTLFGSAFRYFQSGQAQLGSIML